MSEQEFYIYIMQLIKKLGGVKECLEFFQWVKVPHKLKKSMKMLKKTLRTMLYHERKGGADNE